MVNAGAGGSVPSRPDKSGAAASTIKGTPILLLCLSVIVSGGRGHAHACNYIATTYEKEIKIRRKTDADNTKNRLEASYSSQFLKFRHSIHILNLPIFTKDCSPVIPISCANKRIHRTFYFQICDFVNDRVC